jgi:hypothetical protein
VRVVGDGKAGVGCDFPGFHCPAEEAHTEDEDPFRIRLARLEDCFCSAGLGRGASSGRLDVDVSR